MTELIEILQYPWAIRALIASSMVGLMCGMLGCFIVLRNMSLIGDALAHAILPGVVFAFMIVGYSALGFFTGSVLAGLVTALCITWIQQNVETKNDAAIGIVFTAMFSIGVIAISRISKRDGVHLDLKDFLIGNVLGVVNEDLYLTAGILVYVIVSIIVFYRYLLVTSFQSVIAQTMGIPTKLIHYFLMMLLSLAVVASIQTVGVILVVAMLITPPATALLLSNRLNTVILISSLIGLLSTISGLILAILLDAPPGPVMVVTATGLYFLAVIFSPTKGIIFKYRTRLKLQRKIYIEDILKQAFRLQEREELKTSALQKALSIKPAKLQRYLDYLTRKEYFTKSPLVLTNKGIEEAKRLVRAHRLWETYLSNKMGMDAAHIHEEAERFEHLLSDEMVDRVDATLGYPKLDPHGSPIPNKLGAPDFPLSRLELEQEAVIAVQQVDENIRAKLWQLGLLPETTFSIAQKAADFIEIRLNGKILKLDRSLASKVNTAILPKSK